LFYKSLFQVFPTEPYWTHTHYWKSSWFIQQFLEQSEKEPWNAQHYTKTYLAPIILNDYW
jgi:hypothetical protein